MDKRIQAMEKIFSPESIAFVGASNNTGKWGGIILHNLIDGGYQGKLYPVNPREDEIMKHKAYPSVSGIPGRVDLAIFTIPAAAMPGAISDCVKKGVKAGVVVTAGFGELGAEGRDLQDEMVKRARAGGMVLVGPNGQGIAAPAAKLFPWMPSYRPRAGVVGIASQSGNVSTALSMQLAHYGFGCSKVVSAGNCADVTWSDYLDYFGQDPETKVILLYIEGMDDARAFFKAGRKAARKKPVVVLKSGRSEAGTKAAATHTGVLAGSDEVFSAACSQAGMVRAGTLEEAVLTAAAFIGTPLPRGGRVGVITGGGGYGVMAADACIKEGLSLPAFSERTIKKLRKHLPPWWSPNNPLDMVAGLGYSGPKELVPILMESGEVDGVILLSAGFLYSMLDAESFDVDLKNVKDKVLQKRLERDLGSYKVYADFSRRWGKPFIITSPVAQLAIRRGYPGLSYLLEQNIMLYPTIEDSIRAFAALARRHHFLEREGVLAGKK